MSKIAKRKQRKAESRTHQIDVMSGTVLHAPLHPRHQMEGFANMRENDHENAHGTDCLYKVAALLCLPRRRKEPITIADVGTSATIALNNVGFMVLYRL